MALGCRMRAATANVGGTRAGECAIGAGLKAAKPPPQRRLAFERNSYFVAASAVLAASAALAASALPASLLAYLRRKRSTRPAVSISFCLPVKKGWQAEQISTLMSLLLVERVVNVLP